jgi:hypothetical protein
MLYWTGFGGLGTVPVKQAYSTELKQSSEHFVYLIKYDMLTFHVVLLNKVNWHVLLRWTTNLGKVNWHVLLDRFITEIYSS